MEGAAERLLSLFRAAAKRGGWWALAILLVGLAVTVVIAHNQTRNAEEEARQAFNSVCYELELRVGERLREHGQILRRGAAFFSDSGRPLAFRPDPVFRMTIRPHELEIYDGETPTPEALLYRSPSGAAGESASPTRLARQIPIISSGHRWLLCLTQGGGVDYSKAWMVLGGGTALSLLLSALVFSLASTRFAARRMAAKLTEDLTANQERLQNIIDSASEYVWELDHDGTFTYVSPRAAQALGRPVAQILGSKLFDFLPEEERAVLPGFFKRQAEKMEPFENLRHRVLLPDGKVVLQKITGRPIVGKDGKLQGFVGMAMDVTDEEKARAQQAHDSERIETFFEAAIDLLCIVDMEGKFVRVSQAWKDLIGQPSKSIESTRFMDYVHPDDVSATEEVFVQIQTGQPLVGFINRYRTKSGEWRSIEWRAKLIRGNVFAAARDVTDAKAAETALELALERERQTTKIKSRLVSMASHEFRTPLATIRLAADILSTRRGVMDESGIQRALQTILSTTDYMTGIVTDVLDLSSMNSDAQQEALSDFPLGKFLRQIAGEFQGTTGGPAAITFEWDGNPVDCTAIPDLLKSAVNNLLDNAVKYSPQGSPVVLRLRQEGKEAVICVEDQGIGIPEEDVAFLHDPFFRASNAVGIPGTGLGLAIVAEAMQRMGGNVGCSKREGGGTIFTLRLPVAPIRW